MLTQGLEKMNNDLTWGKLMLELDSSCFYGIDLPLHEPVSATRNG